MNTLGDPCPGVTKYLSGFQTCVDNNGEVITGIPAPTSSFTAPPATSSGQFTIRLSNFCQLAFLLSSHVKL